MDISPCGFKSRLEYKWRKTKAKALVFLFLPFCQIYLGKKVRNKISSPARTGLFLSTCSDRTHRTKWGNSRLADKNLYLYPALIIPRLFCSGRRAKFIWAKTDKTKMRHKMPAFPLSTCSNGTHHKTILALFTKTKNYAPYVLRTILLLKSAIRILGIP